MRVTLLYFAGVRDLLHRRDEALAIPDSVDCVEALAEHLQSVRPELQGRLGAVRFAVNEAFASGDEPVSDGDVIALIPPVAGG